MIQIDHLLLAQRDIRETARYRTYLLSLREGEVNECLILHEDDGMCCAMEPWGATNARVLAAVLPGQGESAGLIPGTSSELVVVQRHPKS